MKKLSKPLSKEYLPVVLHIEDLEALVDALDNCSNSVKIEADDCSFSSVAELGEHFGTRRPRNVSLKSSDPYATIDLNPMWAKVYVGSDSTKSAGVFFKLDQIMVGRLRRPAFAYSYYFVWILNGAFFLSSTNLVKSYLGAYSICVPLIFFSWFTWISIVRFRWHSTVYTYRRSSSQPFWIRNRDQLAIALIAAIFGAILGAIATKYIDSLILPGASSSQQQNLSEAGGK